MHQASNPPSRLLGDLPRSPFFIKEGETTVPMAVSWWMYGARRQSAVRAFN
jgi:hypothetical protein